METGEIPSEDIIVNEKIGEGKFGTVWRGKCGNSIVAVKVPRRQRIDPRDIEKFRKEVKIMRDIHHPNIALFMGACTKGEIKIVCELLEIDLEQKLKNQKKRNQLCPVSTRMQWAKDAAVGLEWLHRYKVIHRDLKLPNLMLDKHGNVKVCDFGLSQFNPEDGNLRDSKPKGTPLYMAPEVMMNGIITSAVDVYAFGLLLWELMTGTEVFAHHNSLQKFATAICTKRERPPIPSDCPKSLVDIMTACWSHEASHRPTFEKLIPKLEQAIIDCKNIEQDLQIKSEIQRDGPRTFWKRCFPLKFEVPWPEFISKFCQYYNQDLPDLSLPITMENCPFYCFKKMLETPSKPEIVTLSQFGKVVGWFGPIDDEFLGGISELLSYGWFHGSLSRQGAFTQLDGQASYTYLFRFSRERNSFALSVVDKDGKVQHFLITKGDKGFELDGECYGSLQEIVAQQAQRYHLYYPHRCDKYRELFPTHWDTTIGYTNNTKAYANSNSNSNSNSH